MTGLTETSQAVPVTLRGHLIDSLTLAKVIDLIQTGGGDYRLDDIRIGKLKKELSSVNLTVLAPDADTLARILAEIEPHGAKRVDAQASVSLVSAPADGVAPEGAYQVRVPAGVQVAGRPIALHGGFPVRVLVVDATGGQAELKSVERLKAGDAVVVGAEGVLWQ